MIGFARRCRAPFREVGSFIRREFCVDYKSHSDVINLLHRIDLEYRKPELIGRHLDIQTQEVFVARYDSLMNDLDARDTIVFCDAIHPTFGSISARCWAAKGERLALEQTSGRKRLDLHGGIDLETSKTLVHEAETIGAVSTLSLF